MNSRFDKFFTWFILVLAALLHFLKFDQMPLQYDELLMYEILKSHTYFDLLPHLYFKEIQQPLMYFITKAFGDLFGYSSFVLRLPTLFFTIALPFMFYRLSRLSLNKDQGLKTTALVMLSFPILFFSSTMRPYIPLLFFSLSTSLAYRNFKPSLFMLYVALLFLVSPAGSIISLIFMGIFIFQRKGRYFFGTYILFILLAFISFYFTRSSDFNIIFSRPLSFTDVWIYFRSLTFLASGKEFLSLILVLLIYSFYKQGRSAPNSLDRFHLNMVLISSSLGFLILFFSNNQFGARHLIVAVPSIMILFIQLADQFFKKRLLINGLFLISICFLLWKAIIKEKILTEPWETASSAMATKAQELAGKNLKIVSCGNCLSYYIKTNQLFCVSKTSDPSALFNHKEKLVYIDFNYYREGCGYLTLEDRFQVESRFDFKGGKVFLLTPKEK